MRELKLMLIASVVALFVGVGLFGLSNLGAQSLQREHGVPYTVIQEGLVVPTGDPFFSGRKNLVFRTQNDFDTFWSMFSTDKKPSIIFTKDQAIAVFQGTQPTEGYAIKVTDIRDTKEARVVFITLEVPGPGCEVAQTVTNPYQIISVPKSDKPLKAIETFQKISC